MPTKLSRYAEGFMEALWLAAVICVPVFFNVYSSRIFEPDKITLLRSLALFMLAAWLIKLLEQGWRGENRLKNLLQTPMVLPVLALALTYLLATVFSIHPRVSFWGSYQRLQGTYTALSYFTIFAVIAANLRRREQVERLVTTIILASLPISLYAILQRYKLDPIPWGGDVTVRVAANMGNSIFVAAYIVMVSPLTLTRMFAAFRKIMAENAAPWVGMTQATIYVFIAILQGITLFFSGSRGPLLGWLAALFFVFVLMANYWQRRTLLLVVVALAIAAGGFLALLNIPNGPLESLRQQPVFNRYARILDTEYRTGRVRTLIWRGAVELVQPHDPLQYPDGSTDRWNFIRPLIGYGPETMYVAYNPFYQPELTQVERRNASPDRSHNETWDALVITGALGLGVQLWVFAAVFYFGLKWLGLIQTARQRTIFIAFFIVSGIAGAVALAILQEPGFIGVGLPFGIILGQLAYLTLLVFRRRSEATAPIPPEQALLLIGVLGSIVAHFVEIHFGIAIAATRTYFWTFSALLLVVGFVLPRVDPYSRDSEGSPAGADGDAASPEAAASPSQPVRKRRAARPEPRLGAVNTPQRRAAFLAGAVLAILLVTLLFNYISNLGRNTSMTEIFISSLTRLPNEKNATSYGILALLLTVWTFGSALFAAELKPARFWQTFGTILGISGAAALLYALWQSAQLAGLAAQTVATQQDVITQIGGFESLLTNFYLYLFIILLAIAYLTPNDLPQRTFDAGMAGAVTAPIAALIALILLVTTNLRVVQADIAFKMADPFTRSTQWPVAMLVYQHAIEQAPNEDHYYLFLGRAYLEYTRTLEDLQQRATMLTQAETDLKKAQQLNPLNTDHTANLARLYSWWASTASGAEKQSLAARSDAYYSQAVKLSPKNAVLWGEWATLKFSQLNQDAEAEKLLQQAIEIDPYYDRAQALLGDYYMQRARAEQDAAKRSELYTQAAGYYTAALALVARTDKTTQYTYNVALASVYLELQDYPQAIEVYKAAAEVASTANRWRVEETIARVYAQLQDKAGALEYAQKALANAPDSEQSRIGTLIQQIQALP
ncbi:MAG: hypothetical protein OHK0052_27320 [Anaerolineales bacterium]